ncbi:MAG: EamA family transporter [Gemmatimonadales bacterium]
MTHAPNITAAGKQSRPPLWQTLLAFATIYLVWGSTFLAIRIGVHEVPPVLLAAIRFLVAGGAMVGWLLARGVAAPTAREWRSAFLLALPLFLLNYGLLFWAETRITSGVTAVMQATIPAFTTLSEIIILGSQRLSWRLAGGLALGLIGVAVLTSDSLGLGTAAVDRISAAALLVASIGWAVGSVLTRKLRLPASQAMSSGAQMLAGGLWLAVAAIVLGEGRGFDPRTVSPHAWLALLYLIVAGSIAAFTAYLWLIHHVSPTRVSTYAYVNPVVAVLLGYFAAGEPLSVRTLAGAPCILLSVLVISTMRRSPATVTRR